MSERAAALPVETTQAHGDSSTKCHSEISLVRLFCQSELALQKCLCTDPPALDGSKSRSDRSSWVRLQQLFPKRRTALCLDRPHRVFLSCSAHHKARGCDRQRSPPEPARPLRGHLSPGRPDPRPHWSFPGGRPRIRAPPAQAHGRPRGCPLRQAGVKFWRKKWGLEARRKADPPAGSPWGGWSRGSPRQGDPRALEAPGATAACAGAAPRRPYLYSRPLTWSDL